MYSLQELKSFVNAPTAFNAATNTVRAGICLIIMGSYLFMQWRSGANGTVAPAIVGATGLVTGYYLTGESSATMKALVSLIYVSAFAYFYIVWNWAPEAVISQVTNVIGIYFGLKTVNVTPKNP